MTVNLDQTTREIAIRNPEAVPVFESLGIDYCCGGSRSLKDACNRANVDPNHLTQLLEKFDKRVEPATDWIAEPLDALSRHIVERHHAYVRRVTPQIENWLNKVVTKHGAKHPEVREIQQLFESLAEELFAHMLKEERVLFPYLELMAAAERENTSPAKPFFDSVEIPISRMLAEHDDAGELTARIHELSGGYQPPADACPTFHALYNGLAEFERDLHQHVHLENNILFPRALDLERQAFPVKEREYAGS
jgi:regulator of cell morphogenesis and NO signaling